MKRRVAVLGLAGFLVYTGLYLFVYLFRAFRLDEPAEDLTVYIWHGDPMMRAVFVGVLFAIGLLIVTIMVVTRPTSRSEGSVRIRGDLWEWLRNRADQTNDTPEQITDRALAAYRSRIESPSRQR